MSSCIGLCLPPVVLLHTALERSDFSHMIFHRDCCGSFSGCLVTCLLWRCNLYVFPPIKCASFRSEFTLLVFKKGNATTLLKFLRRFLVFNFFPKKVNISAWLWSFVIHLTHWQAAISCLIADASPQTAHISGAWWALFLLHGWGQWLTWVTPLLTNKTCWGVFPEPKDSTADNLLDEGGLNHSA